MDRKGFTLVELLVAVVLLSLVLGIVSYSVLSVIENSKLKNERIFVDRLKGAIENYIRLNSNDFVNKNINYSFDKCRDSDCVNSVEVNADEFVSVNISNLISDELLDDNRVVNPVNKKNCFDGKDPLIRIFRDSDYVYYFYVDLRGDNTSCEISDENGIIDTLPDSLRGKVGL